MSHSAEWDITRGLLSTTQLGLLALIVGTRRVGAAVLRTPRRSRSLLFVCAQRLRRAAWRLLDHGLFDAVDAFDADRFLVFQVPGPAARHVAPGHVDAAVADAALRSR